MQRSSQQIIFNYAFIGSFSVDRIKSRGREAVGCSAGELAGDSKADWAPSLLSPTAEQPSLALPQLHPLPAQSQCHSAVQASLGRGQVSSAGSHSFPGGPAMPPPTSRGRGHRMCMYSCHSPDLPPLNGLLQSHSAPRQATATLPPNPRSSWVPVHLHPSARPLPPPRVRASRHLRVNPASPSASISLSLR